MKTSWILCSWLQIMSSTFARALNWASIFSSMNLTTITNNLTIVATNSNLVPDVIGFVNQRLTRNRPWQLAWQVGNKQKRGQAEEKRDAATLRERQGDKSCGEDGGSCFFRVLTPATFLFMCGTNGFRPLKFPLLSSRRFENRRIGVDQTGRSERGTKAVRNLNKKNAVPREKFFDSNYACKRVPPEYGSRVIQNFCSSSYWMKRFYAKDSQNLSIMHT